MLNAIVLDTETTSADADREVIELAYAEVQLAFRGCTHGEIQLSRFSNTRPMSFGAMATHHIIPEDLQGLSPFYSSAIPEARYFIGHKVDFDWEGVGSPDVKRICTLAIARKVWPDCDSHTLSALMYYLYPDKTATRFELKNAHNAGADVLFCLKILSKFLNAYPEITTMEQLWQFSEEARIPSVMPFGKFKGEPVSSVDNGYRAWYSKQPNQDPYLLQAFRKFPYVKS